MASRVTEAGPAGTSGSTLVRRRLAAARGVFRATDARLARPAGTAGIAGTARTVLLVAVVLGVIPGLVACAGTPAPVPSAPAVAAPPSSPSPAVIATRAALQAALQAHGLGLIDGALVVRPPEPPSFADVPRWPFLVPLAADPTAGLIVVYELPSVQGATDAGQRMAAYLGSGPGRVQRPADVQVLLRQVGSTLVLFSYSSDATDPKVTAISAALEGVRSPMAIPGG